MLELLHAISTIISSLTEQRLDHFAVVQEMSNIMLTLRQVRVKARFRQ